MGKVTYLVVDSGGFIKNPALQEIGENIITTRDVVDEIRDKATKQRLQVLPYELEFRQPSAAGMRVVTEFSKKTGDYSSLSGTDLKVLAVAYDLTADKVGTDHLNREPTTQRTVQFYRPGSAVNNPNANDTKISGFYTPNGDGTASSSASGQAEKVQFDSFNYWREPLPDLDLDVLMAPSSDKISGPSSTPINLDTLDKFLSERSYLSGYQPTPVDFVVCQSIESCSISTSNHPHVLRWSRHIKSYPEHAGYNSNTSSVSLAAVQAKITANRDFIVDEVESAPGRDVSPSSEENSEVVGNEGEPDEEDFFNDEGVQDLDSSDKENNESYEEEGDEDSDDGWITPSNVKEKKAAMGGGTNENIEIVVGCMTTDFAMQNVLKQIGLHIIGTNGMLIKETKTWILRCYGCFHTTPAMEKKFCPRCGNKTLKRVSVTLNDDGTQQIHISTRRQLNRKGKKFSLPAPKGGKHAFNPKLVEDQREAQQRISKKAMVRNNPLDPDFIAGSSPFAVKDVTSKSAMLGLKAEGRGQAHISGAYWNKRNPNSGSTKTGSRK